MEDAFILGRNMVHLEDGFSETLLPVLVVNRRKYKEWSLELNASVDQAKAEAIIERLRQISLNTSITLKEIQNGGSRLIIESSKIIFEEIEMLRRIEKLVYLEGIRIEAVKMIPRLKPNLP